MRGALVGRRAAIPGLRPRTQDSSGLGTVAPPFYQGCCQHMPAKGCGRRALVSHEGAEPERKQEGRT